MVRITWLKRFWNILICVWIGLSAAVIPLDSAMAQTATPTPALEYCLDHIGSGEDFGEISLQATSAITLVYFCVEYYPARNELLVMWETATELDTAGYVIWRSDTEAGTYEEWSPFIQAEGGLVSMTYKWEDLDVAMGNVYYYKLEEINTNNVSVFFYGPVRFDFYSPTATATKSPTPMGTPTRTATASFGSSPTFTPTRTYTPFPTSIGTVSTAVPSPDFSAIGTQTTEAWIQAGIPISVTATLQPLPPILLLFPVPTVTPPNDELAMLQVSRSEDMQVAVPTLEIRATLTSRIWLLGGIVLLLWIVLGTFLVFYLRKAQG